MSSKTILISMLTILLCSCGSDDGTNDNSKEYNKDDCAQNTNALILNHDDALREYFLYIPSSYDATASTPLMFNFHGFGGQASDFMDYADMKDQAESGKFILVYPQGTCLDGSSHWNATLPSADNKSNTDDFGFFEALLTEISSNYNIDAERVYVCGFSNGAMFAYALACYKGDLIAAIGSVSGAMLSNDCTSTHAMSLINIHGTSDGVLPYEGNVDFNSVAWALNHWINFNNNSTMPQVTAVVSNNVSIEHYAYNNGENGVSVEHYKVIDGDHDWLDIEYQGKNTSTLLWGFLSKYDINGLR